ncbi:putative tricarboxylate transport protein TctB [Hyphomicrobiales bacterium]|nr:putative tricarboxylate transport protein TctB [Hyphomicrobiales bacterium]CAH1694783.1 putative tricarboxylate transport protein TctB [Hyphomicrobiales bacterium]
MRVRRINVACGAVFTGVGLFFGISSLLNLPVGQASAMGPGYFPIVLSTILCALGMIIVLSGEDHEAPSLPPISWRAVILVTGAALFFGMTVRGLGMAPSLLIATFMATMATGQLTPRQALLLSVILTLFNIGVFVFALRLPYAIIGPWLGS